MLRYYPSSKVLTNQSTSGGEYALNGESYKGKYYITYDGKAYTGTNPETGPSELLTKQTGIVPSARINPINLLDISNREDQKKLSSGTPSTSGNRIPGKPNSYFPNPTALDYKKGYVIRYFTKKENEKGFIIEISQEEYNSIVNGTADFDTRLYQVAKILWKITGPLNSQRQSQYNIIPGIIETNQRLTEAANKNFLGIVDFIGGEYSKFARPTV